MPLSGVRASPATVAEPEEGAQVQRVVVAGALVAEHDVVRTRHAHHVVHAGGAEQGQQAVHVVLVGLGVVGVADVHSHRQAEQLAAEMVFKAGAGDLLAVVEVFRADKADDGIDEQRPIAAGHGIGASFAGLLVHAVVCISRQSRALTRFEVHDVLASRTIGTESAAMQQAAGIVCLMQQ